MFPTQKIDELFRIWQEGQGAGGVLIVNHKGERLERVYGYQNIETGTLMSPDSVFHLASMSKQITVMGIAMLCEQGKLTPDDDVRQYIPEMIRVSQPITIAHLMHHTSGLPDNYGFLFLSGLNKFDRVTHAQMMRLTKRIDRLNFEPGEEYAYSNVNYDFLALIVERITGMPFARFCQENIFEPLGMTHTVVRDDPEMLIPNRVNSYMDDGYAYKNAIFNLCMYGSTGVQSTARDMEIYLHQYTNPTLISRETMDRIILKNAVFNNGTPITYAGGVMVENLCEHRIIHHGGGNAGFRTAGLCMPDDDLYVVLFSNTQNLAVEAVAKDVARLVLDLPARNTDQLAPYREEGVEIEEGFYYAESLHDGFTITKRGDTVYCNQVPLTHLGANCYKLGRVDMSFAFGKEPMLFLYGALIKLTRCNGMPEQVLDYVGDYECRLYDSKWKVLWEDDALWLYHLRHGRMPLSWVGGERFCFAQARYDFCRDGQGKVIGFVRVTDRQRYMMFNKTEKNE